MMGSYNKVLATFSAFLLITLIIIAYPTSGQSQIYHCGDTWTNQPCAGATPRFDEVTSTTSVVGNGLKKEKEAIVHQLVDLRYRVKAKFSLDVQTASAEKFCALEETTANACQERVDSERDKIDSKVIEIQKLKIQERELALKEQTEMENGEQNNTAVIIQNIGINRATPTGTITAFPYPPQRLPVRQVPTPANIPAPSRGEVPNDARVPLQR